MGDNELKKAFEDLKEKMIETRGHLKIVETRAASSEMQRRRAELTQKELSTMPENTIMYRSVGRMFIQEDRKSITDSLTAQIKTQQEIIDSANSQKRQIEQRAQEAENNLRELLKSKKIAA
eukprot:m.48036 g.48036  ORF g.48036 m.48036 type:complete len:121 (-) comp12694_c0_seq1:617-979(-)